MVHYRINERETNPNPHINFVSALPGPSEPAAKELLRALAAQVRPIMKDHGFTVNSFEEYEYNEVFAGRNWEAGETIELVLRRPHGGFYPTWTLLNVLCHELAHIKHMNHLSAFQKLWAQLRNEVRALRAKGYYGDGYWSAGTRLGDGSTVDSQNVENEDMPEYVCGGAQSRPRAKALGRRRRRVGKPKVTPSNHTGAQTEKKRKTGSRITSQELFQGYGHSLSEGGGPSSSKVGSGFKKRANTQKAKAERADLIERRLQALEGSQNKTSRKEETETDSGSEDEDDSEVVPETDSDRRRRLLDEISAEELAGLKCSLPEQDEYPIAIDGGTDAAQPVIGGSRPRGRQPEVEINALDARRVSNVFDTSEGVVSGKKLEWACDGCTFVNPDLFLMCGMCDRLRPS